MAIDVEALVGKFNEHLVSVLDLFLDLYPDDHTIHGIHATMLALMDKLPYKVLDEIGPYTDKFADRIVKRDADFFLSGDFKISDDKEVLEFTNMFQKYWKDIPEPIHKIIFDRVHNMLYISAEYEKVRKPS